MELELDTTINSDQAHGKDGKTEGKALVIGWDNRYSSQYLVSVISLGWGGKVRRIGLCSTPVLHWCAEGGQRGYGRTVGKWCEEFGGAFRE
ncbi:hypothetical protein TrRE_jg1924, partial [Triparma retinervis]